MCRAFPKRGRREQNGKNINMGWYWYAFFIVIYVIGFIINIIKLSERDKATNKFKTTGIIWPFLIALLWPAAWPLILFIAWIAAALED